MKLRFCVTTKDTSVRAKELEDSERRAHAARTAYRRKTAKYRKVEATTTFVKATLRAPDTNLSGCSDPFSCFGVKITPEINRILAFMRDIMYPAIYLTPWTKSCSAEPLGKLEVARPRNVVSAASAHRDWRRMLCSLQDEGLGLACLSACASFVPGFRETTKTSILQMRARSTSLLRQRLMDPAYGRSGSALLQMFWLFEAEALDNNVEAALIHGRAFRQAVETCQDLEIVDLGNIVMFLWADTNFAAKTMQRTMLSMDWCIGRLQGLWNLLGSFFPPPIPGEDSQLNLAVEAETLRAAIIELRRHLALSNRPFTADQCSISGSGDRFYVYTATRNMVNYGLLLNLYCDLMEGKPVKGVLSDGQRYTQAALVLAYLLIEQVLTSVYIDAIDVRDSTKQMADRMVTTSVMAHVSCTLWERNRYADAHLWALYIGFMHEYKRTCGTLDWKLDTALEPNTDTLRQLLREQMKRMHISTWEETQSVAKTFVHNERILPLERLWFESQVWMIGDLECPLSSPAQSP